jgi:hypothetical protein
MGKDKERRSHKITSNSIALLNSQPIALHQPKDLFRILACLFNHERYFLGGFGRLRDRYPLNLRPFY